MAKTFYKIPASINRSMLDHEVVISGGGMRMRPLAIKVVLYWVAVLFFLLWALLQSPVSKSPVWLMVVFVIWTLVAAAYFGQYTKTKELKIMQLPALLSYLPKAARNVTLRRNSEPYGFMSIVGIKGIEEDGLIRFLDGGVGQAYSIVGSGSLLLFDQDRENIVNRVDSFHRKIDTRTEWIYMTTKEPQRVYRQLANLERENLALRPENRHPELRDLLMEKYDILTEDVGGKFNSIHQYLILRSPTLTDLRHAHSVLASEVENSQAMFKSCTMLDGASTPDALRVVFAPRDKNKS